MSTAAVLALSLAFPAVLLAGAALGARGGERSGLTEARLRSVTRRLFVSTQISALVWVFTSYAIAVYSTVRLQQVYTMEALSRPAIDTILGVTALKVVENIFEHNNSAVFGSSAPPASRTDADGDT